MTVYRIFLNRLIPSYVFHFGPHPPGSEPSETVLKSLSPFLFPFLYPNFFFLTLYHTPSITLKPLPPTSISPFSLSAPPPLPFSSLIPSILIPPSLDLTPYPVLSPLRFTPMAFSCGVITAILSLASLLCS